MIKFNYIFAIISCLIIHLCQAETGFCIKQDSCFCQISEDDKIDISTVVNDNEYLSDSLNANNTFTYLGCKDRMFQNDTNLKGILVWSYWIDVIVNKTVNTTVVKHEILGNSSTLRFSKDENNYILTFNSTNNSNVPTIVLLCDNFNIPFLKILDLNSQKLLLSSPKLCVITTHHGMSGGSVFLLIFFISASIYFIGGALILYFIRGARGVEMIPNIEFWKNLPGLVKDGLIFLLSGCRPNFVTTAETYDKI